MKTIGEALEIGLGIGLTFPMLSAAAVSTLPPNRFAVGSAVNQTARQIGGAIGVATLVLLLGSPASTAAALDGFHHLWLFAAATAIGSGVIGSLIPRPATAAAAVDEMLADEGVPAVELAVAATPG